MRIMALEEHFSTREVRDAWSRLDPPRRDGGLTLVSDGEAGVRLDDLSEARAARMDAAGVDVAVLSLTTPGVQNLDADVAVPLARARTTSSRRRPGDEVIPIALAIDSHVIAPPVRA